MSPLRRRSALVLAVGLAAGAGALDGQQQAPSDRLTLAEAVGSALESHPGIRAARFSAEGASATARGVAAARWPTLSLSTSVTRFQEPMPVTPIHGFTPDLAPVFDRDLFQGGTSLRYTVFDGQGRGARTLAAQEDAAAADVEVVANAQTLTLRVATAFLGVLGGAAVLEAQDRRLAALEAERARARQLLEAGRAAEIDVLRVEAALASAQAERVSLASSLEVAELELSRLTGLPDDRTRARGLATVVLTDSLAAARDEALDAALRTSPTVLTQRRRVAAADALGAVARSARWPRIDVSANYLGWASADQDPITEWNAGLSLSVPVFTGGAVKHQVEGARAALNAARERLRLAEREVGRALDQALSSLDEARARVASLSVAVARSEEVARIERLRLETGSGVQSDYVEAEAVLFGNRAALVQARYARILARVGIARATGELDVEWLQRALGGTP